MRDRQRGKKALKGTFKFVVLPVLALIFLNWKWALSIFGFFLIVFFFKVLKRKYFAKDIYGNKLTFKQFMKRWKDGIEGITPLQQARTSVLGTWIVVSGLIGGIGVMAIVRPENIWIFSLVILVGSLIITVMALVGGLQKMWKFKEMDKIQKEFERQMNEPKTKKQKEKKVKDKIEVEFEKIK